jgi:hypothetical protein
MDLVSRDRTERDGVFEEKRVELEKRSNALIVDGKEEQGIRCFATSIYDESLYKVSWFTLRKGPPFESMALTHECPSSRRGHQ